jgi:hypothetical protein
MTGHLTVALPPEEAFRLFTATGERDWAPDWDPHFPEPVDDETALGTVFQTGGHGHLTTWIVVDSVPGRLIRYARVAHDATAGTVLVNLDSAGDHSDVTVTYELTALTDAARGELDEFAANYPAFLQSWQDAIASVI